MQRRVPALEASRGVAALAVLLFHWWVAHGRSPEWADAFGYGWLGVQVFFVLSGLVLFLPYARGNRLDLGSYAARRFLRIFPAWWVFVLVGGLLLGTPFTTDTLVQLSFLQMWFSDIQWGWTLPVEALFYVSLPLLVWATARYRPLRVPLLVLLIPAGWVSILVWQEDHRVFTPLTWIDQFAWGMLAALAIAAGVRVRWWAVLGSCVGLALLLASAPSQLESPYGFPYANLTTPLFAVLLAWLATADLRVPAPLVWLGTVSYGLFLWHAVTLPLLNDRGLQTLPDPVELTVLIPASLAFAWGSWRLVERPAIRFSRRVRRRRALDPVVVPAQT